MKNKPAKKEEKNQLPQRGEKKLKRYEKTKKGRTDTPAPRRLHSSGLQKRKVTRGHSKNALLSLYPVGFTPAIPKKQEGKPQKAQRGLPYQSKKKKKNTE